MHTITNTHIDTNVSISTDAFAFIPRNAIVEAKGVGWGRVGQGGTNVREGWREGGKQCIQHYRPDTST